MFEPLEQVEQMNNQLQLNKVPKSSTWTADADEAKQ